MRTRVISERLTPGRRAFLERLANEGTGRRTRDPAGYHCMCLGWTEWAWRRCGKIIGQAEMERRYARPGDLPVLAWDRAMADGWSRSGEMLTAAGRAFLEGATP